jgi:hypothetical protein
MARKEACNVKNTSSQNAKSIRLDALLCQKTNTLLAECCKTMGLNKSEVVREGIRFMHFIMKKEKEVLRTPKLGEFLISTRRLVEYDKAFKKAFIETYVSEYTSMAHLPHKKADMEAKSCARIQGAIAAEKAVVELFNNNKGEE